MAFANQDVFLGGIVTDVRMGQTRTGKPYGIAKLEDYSGAGEIALFGEDWAKFSGYFHVGNSLFITARVEERQWQQGAYELKIGRIEFLSDVKDQKIKSITINVATEKLTLEVVNELASIIRKSPGPTDVFFNILDNDEHSQVMLQSKLCHVSVDSLLINYLKRLTSHIRLTDGIIFASI